MKNIKKICLLAFILCLFSLTLVGCSTSKSYTFKINDTNENIEVKLQTGNGYKLTQNDGVFTVTKDKEDVVNGTFLTEDMRSQYVDAVEAGSSAVVLEDTADLYVWTVEGETGPEYNRIVSVPSAKTYVLMGSLADKATADAAFARLSFTLK